MLTARLDYGATDLGVSIAKKRVRSDTNEANHFTNNLGPAHTHDCTDVFNMNGKGARIPSFVCSFCSLPASGEAVDLHGQGSDCPPAATGSWHNNALDGQGCQMFGTWWHSPIETVVRTVTLQTLPMPGHSLLRGCSLVLPQGFFLLSISFLTHTNNDVALIQTIKETFAIVDALSLKGQVLIYGEHPLSGWYHGIPLHVVPQLTALVAVSDLSMDCGCQMDAHCSAHA